MRFECARRLCLTAYIASATPALSERSEGLDLSGTMRVRYEGISGQPRLGYNNDDGLINLRTTLLAGYRSGPFTIGAELWDSRVYSDDAAAQVTTGEVNTLEFVQAWVRFSDAAGATKVSAQAGRFLLNLGSRRLVAADDYRNTINGYTGLRGDITTVTGITATAIYVLPQQRRPDDLPSLRKNEQKIDHEGFDLVVWGGTAAKANALGPFTAEASFYHLAEKDHPRRSTRDRSLNTYGVRLVREPLAGKVDAEIEALRQSGSLSRSTVADAPRLSVAASFIHVSVGYTFLGRLKARLSAQYDRASGDRDGGKYSRFDTLFGMRRAELAPSGLYNAVGRANISTPGVRAEIAPSRRWDAFIAYRALWLAAKTDSFSTTGVQDAGGRSGSFAGQQFDGRIRWWIRPEKLRLEVDGVLLVRGRFLENAPNASSRGVSAYGSVNLTVLF
ncbi:alginate export family protein [Sphingobium sp. HWE2-09]|uniref:alginate export family protein n=1 Tax=Sphingobium sp. HWE2-09 TaxID=3108390 RepID=UPI002DCD2DD8|nr:alginate export family protein [Sphingobium sp. HWE2-09]